MNTRVKVMGVFSIVAMAFLTAVSEGKRREDSFILLEPNRLMFFVLDIEVVEPFDPKTHGSLFQETFDRLLKEVDFPTNWIIVSVKEEMMESIPYVELAVRDWGYGDTHDCKIHLRATLRYEKRKNKIGFYRNSEPVSGFGSHVLSEEAMKKVMIQSITELLGDLSLHFYREGIDG